MVIRSGLDAPLVPMPAGPVTRDEAEDGGCDGQFVNLPDREGETTKVLTSRMRGGQSIQNSRLTPGGEPPS